MMLVEDSGNSSIKLRSVGVVIGSQPGVYCDQQKNGLEFFIMTKKPCN